MQSIKDTLELLAPGWVGSIIGLIGIAAAALTYFLTRQRTILAFNYEGDRLLGLAADGLPSEIKVSYRGQDIPRLTRTLVVFWNAGEKTILSEDVIKTDPLRLKFKEDSQVLAATVLKCSRDVNQIQATLGAQLKNEVTLNFAFLDSRDGAVIEVLHTSEDPHSEFQGTVRGLPKGIHNLGSIHGKVYPMTKILFAIPNSPRKLAWVALALGIAMSLIGLFVPLESLNKLSEATTSKGLAMTVAGVLYALLGGLLLFLTRRKYPKALHINELE